MIKPVVVVFGLGIPLVVGITIGASTSHARVVEQAVPVPGPTVTKTVAKPVTPQACLTALDDADQAFDLASRAISDVLNGDNASADNLIGQMNSEGYNKAKSACRASAADWGG